MYHLVILCVITPSFFNCRVRKKMGIIWIRIRISRWLVINIHAHGWHDYLNLRRSFESISHSKATRAQCQAFDAWKLNHKGLARFQWSVKLEVHSTHTIAGIYIWTHSSSTHQRLTAVVLSISPMHVLFRHKLFQWIRCNALYANSDAFACWHQFLLFVKR